MVSDPSHALPDPKLDELLLLEQQLRSGTPLAQTHALSPAEVEHATFLLEQLRLLQSPLNEQANSPPRDESLPRKIGKYRIDQLLGCGGFAIVYRGWDSDLNRHTAIKVPLPRSLVNEDLRHRFLQESQTTAQLVHPHIVPIYESSEAGSVPYIALALCDGPTLAEYLKEKGPLPFETAAQIVMQIADAVEYSHQRGILHRDIKPANILLFKNEGSSDPSFPYTPRLSDFGLAKILEDAALQSRTSVMLGTAMYLAPEMMNSSTAIGSKAADIFGLGAVLYELISGHPPYFGESLFQVLEAARQASIPSLHTQSTNVPVDLASICHQAISKAPQDRYQSSGELRDDLQRFIKKTPVNARPLPCCRRLLRWMQEPARTAEASSFVLVSSIVLLMWLIVWPVAIPFGFRFVKGLSLEELMPYTAPLIILHGVSIFLALKISHRKLWAVIITTLLAGVVGLFQSAVVMSWISPPYPNLYANERTRDIVFLLLIFIFFLQTLLSAFAWISIQSQRARN